MKKNILKLVAAFTVLVASFAFVSSVATFKADVKSSKLVWEGKKITGSGHTGEIKLKSGSFVMDGANLKSGEFVIDMNSMTCTDLTDQEYNAKLIGHLKSDDFFSVAKFSEAKIKITSATNKGKNKYDVKGDLTVKGITHPVEFPAEIVVTGSKATATALITVDRAKYDVKYGSGSFFEGLGDNLINDNFTIALTLVSSK